LETATLPVLKIENPSRVVWALAWPAVALNSLQVVNTLLDRFFIGHLEGAALTAQGASQNVMFLMFSIAMAIGTAATAIVSRSFGAEDVAGYRIGAKESVSVTAIVGILMAAASALLSPIAAHWLLPPNDHRSMELMTKFLLAYSAGLPAIYIIQSLAGSLRGIGDTKSPMVISGLQILLHILLNFLLIFPPRVMFGIHVPGAGMGLVGASTALSISAWMSAILYLAYSGRTPLGALWKFTVPTSEWVMRILRIALPAAAMAILRVLSLTAFTLVLAQVKGASEAIAAMSIGFAIEAIMFMPSFGLSQAASALVGQSLGMKRPDRAERLSWVAAHHAGLVTLALALPIAIFAHPVALYLVDGKEAIAGEAALLMRYLCSTEIMFAYAMVLIGAMQGAGDTVRPMWISIIALWGLRVPLTLFLALAKGAGLASWLVMPFGAGMGAAGAWFAMSFTQGIQGVLCILAFKQGGWKLKKV
jgi:putative MATE family efflux protein